MRRNSEMLLFLDFSEFHLASGAIPDALINFILYKIPFAFVAHYRNGCDYSHLITQ